MKVLYSPKFPRVLRKPGVKNNQILYMRFQCTDVYGCPKLLDMDGSKV